MQGYQNVNGGVVGGVLRTAGAITRGAARGIDETSNAVVGAAGWLAEKSGLGQLVAGDDFREWWSRPIRESNPLQFGAHVDWVHERADGMLGVVESLSQFAVGMVGAGKVTKLAGLRNFTNQGWRARFALSSAEGAAADLVAFGADEQSVLEPLRDLDVMPAPVQSAVRRYLTSTEDDGELEGRLKNALEGFVLGGALEGAVQGFKALRRTVRGLGAANEADALARNYDEAAGAAEREDLYDVKPDPATGEAVVIRKATGEEVGRATSVNEAVDLADAKTWADVSAKKLVPDITPEVAQDFASRIAIGEPDPSGSLFKSIGRVEFGLEATAADVIGWADELIAKHGEAFAVARSKWGRNGEAETDIIARAEAATKKEGATDASLVDEAFSTGLDDIERARIVQAALGSALNGHARRLQTAMRALAKHPLDADIASTAATALSRWLSVGVAHSAYGTAFGRALRDRQTKAGALSFLSTDGVAGKMRKASTLNRTLTNDADALEQAERRVRRAIADGDERTLEQAIAERDAARERAFGTANNVEAMSKRAAEREVKRLSRMEAGVEAELRRLSGDRAFTLTRALDGTSPIPERIAADAKLRAEYDRLVTRGRELTDRRTGLESDMNRTLGDALRRLREYVPDDTRKSVKDLQELGGRATRIVERRAQARAELNDDASDLLAQAARALDEGGLDALDAEDPVRVVAERIAKLRQSTVGRVAGEVTAGLDALRGPLGASESAGVRAIAEANDEALFRIYDGRTAEARAAEGEALAELRQLDKSIREDFARELDMNPLNGMTREDMLHMARTFSLTDGIERPEIFQRLAKVMHGIREARVLEAKGDPSFYDRLVKYRTQAMLLRVGTHTINIVGNAVTGVQLPAELAWAGVNETVRGALTADLKRVRSGRDMMTEGKDMLVGWITSAADSWRMARMALSAGGPVLDRMPGRFEALEEADGVMPWELLGKALDFGSRLLVAEDEFFKNMAYRSSLYADAHRSARQAGLTGADAAKHIAEYTDRGFFGDGSGASLKGIDYARYATFSRPMGTETRQKMLDIMSTGPGRWLFPFRKTPLNMIFFAAERTPGLARLTHEYQTAMRSGDARAIAEAKSREQIGTALYATAAGLALTGNLTGRGPADPKQRKEWLAAGFQPYSVRIGDQWISYRRLENVNTPFQVVADLTQMGTSALDSRVVLGDEAMSPTEAIGFYAGLIGDMIHAQANTADDRADEKFTEMAGATVLSLMSTIADKALLTTAADFMESITSGDPEKAGRFFTDQVSTLVPGIVKEVFKDDHRRELEDFVTDGILRYTSFSGGEPQRNILGVPTLRGPQTLVEEPDGSSRMDDASWPFVGRFSPFHMSPSGGIDKDMIELLKLGRSVAMPEDSEAEGFIDLRDRALSTHGQSVYDRMGEIAQNGEGNLPPLRTMLRDLFASDAYQMSSGGTATRPGGSRAELVRALVRNYYALAKTLVEGDPRFEAYRVRKQDVMRERAALLVPSGM